MRIFYDCEFIEDGKTIDLISIGMVAEDERMYYAQNADCDLTRANKWVRENVFPSLLGLSIDKGEPVKDWTSGDWKPKSDIAADLVRFCDPEKYGKPEFWGYYSAYDHVALCQLFGTMINLPRDWPMYTNDLKQWAHMLGDPELPTQEDEHHALADARWNKKVWSVLSACAWRKDFIARTTVSFNGD